MSETQRIGGAGGAHEAGRGGPTPSEIVDGYRTRGSLDSEALAAAIYREAGGDAARAEAMKAALAPALSPLERGAVDLALSRQDGISVGEHVVDGVVQLGRGIWGSVKGLGQLAWSGVKTSYDTNLTGLAVDALERRTGADLPDWLPSAERGAARIEAGANAVASLGRAVWNDPSILIQEYETLAADGRYGAIVGQAIADFGDLFVGAKGAGKAGRAAGILGRADDAADLARISRAAETASELARTVRAVPGGADDAADALRATRAALDEIDTSVLPDDIARKVETARGDLVQAQASALWGTEPLTAASLRTGVSRDALQAVLDTPKGSRPPVESYLPADTVQELMAAFDDGVVRVTSRSSFETRQTLGPPSGFAMPAEAFNEVVERAGGDLAKVEDLLGFDPGYLRGDDVMIVHIERADASNLRLPTGNERGANDNWIPGGHTSGGIPEAVMDFPPGTPYTELEL